MSAATMTTETSERICSLCGKLRKAVSFKTGDPVCRGCKVSATRQVQRAAKVSELPAPRRELRCAFCGETKPTSQFVRHPVDRGEYLPYCLPCKPTWNRWRLAHPGEGPEHAQDPEPQATSEALVLVQAPVPEVIAIPAVEPRQIEQSTTCRLASGGVVSLVLAGATVWELGEREWELIGDLRRAVAAYTRE
ncbi:MAG TPA: hypothetical protein VF916_09950 [Ktedonobacterales bacterium]